MKYFIIAGEVSGDLHASKLVSAIRKEEPWAQLRGWGGDEMKKAGTKILKHINELAFMGFSEVIANLGTILSNFKTVKKQIKEFDPDVLVLVDYPGFNMRIAKWAKKQGFKVYYYIAPQAWAWKAGRVKKLIRDVDEMYIILPFEKPWFEKRGLRVNYFGHPLMDSDILDERDRKDFLRRNDLPDQEIIAMLPGSRKQELKRMESVFLELPSEFPEFKFVVAGAPSRKLADYQSYLDHSISVVFDQTYDLLHAANYAMVTSGTATLETALIGTPFMVCYKTSPGTYFMAKRVVKVPYIALANLIAGKKIVEEFIQSQCSPETLGNELRQLMHGKNEQQIKDFQELRKNLKDKGVSRRIAGDMIGKLVATA
ncbi:MAG: lipid-A-disaccharide synthase [Saprospiraceae bacterium]|nr:lipid-A-disaccharide synthase [Saprospiraceae bacterium]